MRLMRWALSDAMNAVSERDIINLPSTSGILIENGADHHDYNQIYEI